MNVIVINMFTWWTGHETRKLENFESLSWLKLYPSCTTSRGYLPIVEIFTDLILFDLSWLVWFGEIQFLCVFLHVDEESFLPLYYTKS